MKRFCVLLLIVSSICSADIGEFDSDLANIGQYIASDSKKAYHPYAPSSPDPISGWDYQIEGAFPTHGYVTLRYFTNNATGTSRNCFRTIGGKACNPESDSYNLNYQFANRFEEVYVCMTGFADGPYAADPSSINYVVGFGIYMPRYSASLGLDDPVVSTGRDLSSYINLADFSSPRTLSMLLPFLKTFGSNGYVRNSTFFEFVHWNEEQLSKQDCLPKYKVSYDIDGQLDYDYLSGDLQGLIRFNSDCIPCVEKLKVESDKSSTVNRVPIAAKLGCDECAIRQKPDECSDKWSNFACLFGFSKFFNFPSKCSYAEDYYSVRCTDPLYVNELVTEWTQIGKSDVIKGSSSFFFPQDNEDGYLSIDKYAAITTQGYVAFPSWNEHLFSCFDPGPADKYACRSNNRHYASIRTLYPRYHISVYKSNLQLTGGSASWGFGTVDGSYWHSKLGRSDQWNVLSMNCPQANASKPGVYNEICNMGVGNTNACNYEIGRCFCDLRWLGIACDIAIPSDITSRTTDPLQWLEDVVDRSASQNDEFQICSTAGKFSPVYTVFYLPVSPTESRGITLRLCNCMRGFEGSPADTKTFVPLYASLFHEVAASQTAARIGLSANGVNTEEWFTPYFSADLKKTIDPIYDGSDIADLLNKHPNATVKNKFFYNWPWYILLHQCMIWNQPATDPPLHVYWDYESFSFIQSKNPNQFLYEQNPVANIYPWPPISSTDRNGKQGIRCMDFDAHYCPKPFNINGVSGFEPAINPEYYTCRFLDYLFNGPHWTRTNLVKSRLYGGDDCSPCGACNGNHSECVTIVQSDPILQWTSLGCKAITIQTPVPVRSDADLAIITQKFQGDFPDRFAWRDSSTSINVGVYSCSPPCNRNNEIVSSIGSGAVLGNAASPELLCHHQIIIGYNVTTPNACACDVNFCGPTCDTQICASTPGAKVCGNGTCVLKPGVSCGYSPDGLVFPGVCKCDNGWEGANCDSPICPFDSNGNMCAGRGTCDPVARKCVCYQPDVDGGPVCNQPSCPRHNGVECNGAVAYGTQQSVCDRNTRKCKCYETLAPAVPSVGLPGWESTDIAVQWTGKWGEKCEHDYAEVCRSPVSKKWCSQPIDSNGVIQSPLSEGYGGCYNTACQQMGTGAAGLECKPSCKCTLEFTTNPYCEISICGHDRCGVGGTCVASCTDTNSQSVGTCPNAEAILNGVADVRADCVCNKVVNGQFFAAKVDGDPCDTSAPTCYTGSTSPCNGNGDCAWNSTHFVCHCHHNHFGSQCEITPQCSTPLGGPCSPPAKCSNVFGATNGLYCVCPVGYLRDANRLCNQERCLKTLGKIAPGNDTCLCPRGLNFHAIPDFLLDKVSTQTKLGCRKGCPINPVVSIVECGANEQVVVNGASVNRSRCIDLMNNDPIYWDDARPAPVCNCSFFARDTSGGLNYFIDDGNGGCKPKCNINGTCSGNCNGARIDPVTLACQCVRGWEGPNCDTPSCNGNQHHSNLDGTGPCVCKAWCRAGDRCDVDLCQLTGGVCAGAAPNDCDCSGNELLKLNNSAVSRRLCVSACQNGGVLNSDKTQCLCPQPYTGRWCQTLQQCNVQFAGSFCNISQCLNGGVPRPNTQVGCICSDRWYQGQLCETDICVGRMYRSTGSCICKMGWSGINCDESTCLPGGEPDVNGFCICKRGYNRTADNIGCSVVTIECVHGQLGFRGDGSQFCSCEYNYTGLDCSTEACALPFIVLSKNPVDNTATCGCPPTLYGPQCEETYCSTGSWFNPNTSTTECKCSVGYQLAINADSTGTRQCVPNPHICDREGTLNWNNDANQFPCQCKQGYTGDYCTTPVEAASTSGGGISAAEIGGIVGGAVVTLLIIGGSFFCFKKLGTLLQTKMRHRKKNYVRIRTES